ANDKDNLSADVAVVNVDDIQSEDASVDKTPGPSIAKRLRSGSGKVVPSTSEHAKTTKKTKKPSLKHVLYGPKKTWSKCVPSTEPKK
ncbi:hypothetical protein A2U01_0084098, partial [Trifolium medium]|nr:hypothetical protein [Trifolium medium]